MKYFLVNCYIFYGCKVVIENKFSGIYLLMSKFESFCFLSLMWLYMVFGYIIYVCNDFMCIF